MAQEIPGLAPWQRRLYAATLLGGGAAMFAYGCAQLFAFARDIGRASPVIVTNTAMSAFPPLGVAIMVFGALFVLPRTADGGRLRPIRTPMGTRDPGAMAVWIGIAGLLLYPVMGIVVDATTSSMLETRGYRARIDDPERHSRYLETQWVKTPAPAG